MKGATLPGSIRRGLLVAAAVSVTVAAAACSASTDETTATADATTTETTTASSTTGADTPSSTPTSTTGSEVTLTGVPVGAGDCVTLSGGTATAAASPAVCGSPTANYRVSQTVRQSTECPADTDQVYYETVNGVEQGALCLDIDWVVDGCMTVPLDQPASRVDCADPDATFVSRATRILEGTDSVDACGGGGGYAYSVRKFVVCVQEMFTPPPPAPPPGG